jgi:outer membrane autotransporter protein
MKRILTVTMALIFTASTRAAIVTTGDVSPADPSTWTSSIDSYIGDTANGTMEVNSGSTITSRNSYIGLDSGVTGSVTVTGGGSAWTNNYLRIGDYGEGYLNVESVGIVTSNYGASIGANSTGIGTVTITGSGSQWITDTGGSNWLYVGDYGTGTLNISNGGVVSSATSVIGNYTGSGTATITGNGSQWTHTGELAVGFSGTGTLTISDGGVVTNTTGYIGESSGVTGTATVTGSGSTWTNSNELYVGDSGTGVLNITAGGTVTDTDGYIGYSSGSDGTVTVDGTNSTWTNTGYFYVGRSGTGTLTIQNGGTVGALTSYIGRSSGSTGTATVTGVGSSWTNTGYLAVGELGTGTLTIADGGTVTNDLWGRIGYGSSGTGTVTVTDAGSTWTNNDYLEVGTQGDGTLNIQNGGVVSNTNGFIGHSSGSTGTVTVTGTDSQWTNSGYLSVGFYGTGTLNIENGGAVSNTYGSIGDESGSTGTATVTGVGSTWTNTNDLIVGESGTGTLTIESGGAVSSVTGFVGYSENTTGTATVTGTGSIWTNTAALYVGNNGNGTLTIADGGTVSNTGFGVIGYASGSAGSVTVNDGTWTTTSNVDLYVGSGGNGILSIENGGAVDSTFAYIGGASGGTGTATVTGAGSTWINSVDLYVGNEGDGTLAIANGGTVSNYTGYIGRLAGSTGTVTVDGAGSTWTNNENLYVGASGTGTLSISNGGEVIAASAMIGATSTLSGDSTLTLDSGNGTLTNHGTIAPGNSIGTLTVDGDVTFENGSTLEAEIDNAGNSDKLDVTGNVTINNGTTLAVNSNGETIQGGQQYTLIEADGSISGAFTTLDTSLVTWDTSVEGDVVYGGSTVVLTSSVQAFDDLSLLCTDNQRACGRAVQQIVDDGGNLGGLTGALQGIVGDNNLRRAYDQLSGQTRPSIASIADTGVSHFTGVVTGRMQSARFASLGLDGPMLAMAGNTTDVIAIGNGSSYDADSLYGFWTKGLGAIGDRDSEDGVNGYDYKIGGFALGLDYQFIENFIAGVTFGYSDTDVDYRNSRDNSRIESIYSGLYGSYKDFDGYIDGIFTYTAFDSETDRYVNFVNEKNEGDFDGYEISAYIEVARNHYFKDLLIQPLCGFEFGYQHQDSYTEKGGASALHYEGQSFESYKSALGVRVSENLFKNTDKDLWAQLRAKWMHEFGDAAAGITTSFASTPGYRFSIKDARMNRDSAVLGAGIKYDPNRNILLFIDYDVILNGDSLVHVLGAGLKFMW